MSKWKPISEAPRDGTPVLIYQPGFSGNNREHHMPDGALKPGENSYKNDDPRIVFYDDRRYAIGYWRPWGGWGNRNNSTVKPTHFMELPKPPEEA